MTAILKNKYDNNLHKTKHLNRTLTCISFFVILFFLPAAILYSQQASSYLIPRRIYVGDPAVLVLPLPAAHQNSADIIITKTDFFLHANNFPSDENIDFHRIILERRTAGSRLMIEFTAFIPGVLEFPAIEIGDEYFTGLSVTVNSILDGRSDRVLSASASTLAMPGTALMLYGSMAAFILIILITIWFIVRGHVILKELQKKWKRRRLFASIKKTEKRLYKSVLKGTDKRIILDKLSEEFRNFLSLLTGYNCRSMTAREFELLPIQFFMQEAETKNKQSKEEISKDEAQAKVVAEAAAEAPDKPHGYNCSVSLGKFFRSCDELRFSGVNINSQDILQLLAVMRLFVNTIAIDSKQSMTGSRQASADNRRKSAVKEE